MRVRLTYMDQNESFANALPGDGISGVLAQHLSVVDWGHDWRLINLDCAFEYRGGRVHVWS